MYSMDTRDGGRQGQPPMPTGGGTQVMYTKKSGNTVYNNYNSYQSKCTGAIQITLGVIMIVTNTIVLLLVHSDYQIGQGIWGGAIFVASGSVGIAASSRKTKCLAISYMILSIFSSILLIPLIMTSLVDILATRCSYTSNRTWRYCEYGPDFLKTSFALIALCSGLGSITAIVGSTLCCRAAACCSNNNDELVSMHIVSQNGNQRILPGNTNQYPANGYLPHSTLPGYEKLHHGDYEVYDVIAEEQMDSFNRGSFGYESYIEPAENNDTSQTGRENYDNRHAMEGQAQNGGVYGYDTFADSQQNYIDYSRYEQPVNYYSRYEQSVNEILETIEISDIENNS